MKIKNKIFIFFYLILVVNVTIKNLNAEIPLYKLNAIKISYKDNNKIIIAEGQAYAVDQFGKEIFSDYIIYDKSKNIINTKNNSKYRDKKGNKIDADIFVYDLNVNKILAKNNVKYIEKNGNIFYFSEFEYFENSNIGSGKKGRAIMSDKSSFESEYLEIDNNSGIINLKTETVVKNIFQKIRSLFVNENKYTTCENINKSKNIKEQCPDWSLSTFQTTHNSSKKMIYHNHAIIKIRNVPVFYTPYFSHPDPTVKRKSGFLPASTKNFTDLGRTIKSPYFWVIDDNTDLTFTPIFYENENHIYLTEYRKQNENSVLHIDTSYSSGYKNLNKKSDGGQSLNRTGGSRNHFFLNFNGQYTNILFGDTDLNIKIERISQKNYLNVNQINTDLIKQDINNLKNSFVINSYRNNEKLHIGATIYETLNIDEPNTKYQYKIPYIGYNNYFEKFNQNISLSSVLDVNNTEGDSKKIIQRNTVTANSPQKIIKKLGILNELQIKTSNLNYYNENISGEKSNLNNEMHTTLGLKNSLPLIRYRNNTEETLQPNIFTKFTTGSMSNVGEGKILNYSDLYSLDRVSSDDNPETGFSVGYGIDYNLNKRNFENIQYLSSNISIGQVLSDVEKKQMPSSSSLNKKTSNIVGNFKFFLNTNLIGDDNIAKKNINSQKDGVDLNVNYNFNISNQIDKILRNDLNISLSKNQNKFTTTYYELHDIGNSQYVEAQYERSFENNLNFIIGARKNLELKYTESNFIETNYESDCFKVGFTLSKMFYQNDDLRKSNNLTLFVTLKPFGQPIAPDLTNLINN